MTWSIATRMQLSVYSRFIHVLSENKLHQQNMFYYVQASVRQMIHTNDLSLSPYLGPWVGLGKLLIL